MKALERRVALILALQFTLLHAKIIEKSKIEDDPDSFRNASALISSNGYPVEDHIVQTEDGYVLSIQRIPHGRINNESDVQKKVVFLQHGVFMSSASWVLNFPGQSLGYALADSGYDVWMGNTRGTVYSKKHLKYSTEQREFWDFSFDEMAEFDLPAMIDYVLDVTAEDKLYYIGHSEGATEIFALLSESPKYNEKLRLLITVAPVVKVGNMASPLRYLSPFGNTIEFFLNSLHVYKFSPTKEIKEFALACENSSDILCKGISTIAGEDSHKANKTRYPVYAAHIESEMSVKDLHHFGQMMNSKQFAKYDYGEKGNMDRYNQTTAPEYDISRITAPVALLWGTKDYLTSNEDSSFLRKNLNTVVFDYKVDFNHREFLISLDAPDMVFKPILSLLAQY